MNQEDCPHRTTDDTIRTIPGNNAIPTQSLGADTIDIDGVRFIILLFGEFSMLFTGDAETDERESLMANHADALDVDVLKASHHGSRNGADGSVNGKSWTDFVTPEDVVISVLPNSPHGHPHDEAMDPYEALGTENVHCTSRHGTVRVYGRADETHRILHQFQDAGSCRFPG